MAWSGHPCPTHRLKFYAHSKQPIYRLVLKKQNRRTQEWPKLTPERHGWLVGWLGFYGTCLWSVEGTYNLL